MPNISKELGDAVAKNNVEKVRELLIKITDPNVIPISTLEHNLACAMKNGQKEIISAFLELVSVIPKERILILSSAYGYINIVEDLLKIGIRADNYKNAHNILCNPMYAAAAFGETEIIKLLIKYNIEIDNKVGPFNPLSAAARGGCIGAVKILVDSGASMENSINGIKEGYNFIKGNRSDLLAVKEFYKNNGFDISDLQTKENIKDNFKTKYKTRINCPYCDRNLYKTFENVAGPNFLINYIWNEIAVYEYTCLNCGVIQLKEFNKDDRRVVNIHRFLRILILPIVIAIFLLLAIVLVTLWKNAII
jgi:DNA-directed RNA polymerase subunit RPC12/RpoP